MATHAHVSGYELHAEKMISSRGIGLFTSMIATLAVVIAVSFALANGVAPSATREQPVTTQPAPGR